MSHGFKLRFDQMRENNPVKSEPELDDARVAGGSGAPQPPNHARNLCLIWPDGKRAFYNYAYLVSAQFDPGSEINHIRLAFSSEGVILKGYGLEGLFMELLDHLPRFITAIDPRYIQQASSSESTIIEIEIETDKG